ncbi:uncharacterized protein LOC125952397 [Anopheles darlingi]|uniref:uncharacterized protein LOC125952397 n=1 Tax=Anopheles darlingi TaxID=43151 RepID=UPI0021005D84|nr:uncharacterized protein LOC125952397 [Anopheles darlingi]
MGNSGSMNGLSAYDDGYHHHHHHPHHNHHHHNPHHHQQTGYHQHHQRYHDAMRGDGGGGGGATSWLDSYQQQRQDQHQHDLHWNNNSSNNNNNGSNHQQQLQQQIKVLPDIPGKVAKLRSTNNGNILHAGGTISKNNQLQRSKSISSPSYQHHQALHEEVEEEGALGGKGGGLGGELMCSLPPPRMLITRSRTQVSMLGGGAPVYGDQGEDTVPLGLRRPPAQFGPRSGPNNNNNRQPASYQSGAGVGGGQRKRFGSEPDLRAPHEQLPSAKEQHGAGGGLLRTPKTAQSKIMKGKNKKKAPGPPISSPEKQGEEQRGGRIIAYSPLRKTNSDTSSTLPSTSTEQSGGGGGGGGRKLRLFKTRAETRKQPAIAKLPEASDAKFAKTKVGAGALSPPVATATATAATNASIKPSSGVVVGRGVGARSTPATAIGGDRVVLEQLPAHPQLRSFFRREKTFDVGLLSLEGRKAPTKPTLSPPLSRRKSIVKSLLEAEPQHQQQQQLDIQHIRRSATAAAVTGSTARKDTGQQQQQARRKPSQMHQPTHQHPGKGAPNTLVIPVEPAEQAAVQLVAVPEEEEGQDEEQEKQHRREEQPNDGDRLTVRTGSLDEIDRTQMDIIDRFAASLLHDSRRFHHSTDSVASSEADVLRGIGGLATSDGQEIALRLRPTLPRKQFDIPRFSPAAAWRLLTTEDEFGKHGAYLARGTELDGGSSSEDRIERVYREPGLPGLQDNKSGDSGISGDAGEGPLPELTGSVRHRNRYRGPGKGAHRRPSPDSAAEEKTDAGGTGGDNTGPRTAATTHHGWSSSALTPWTPQQDLDDDDDDEDDTTTGDSSNHQHQHHHHNHYHHNDFATKGHLFSLSLPRENHLSIYTGGSADDKVEKHVFNSLQKLRKTVSDAFRSEDTTGGGGQVVVGSQNGNDNWFLGRLDTKTRTAGITASAAAAGSSAAIGGSSYDKRPYGHGDHHSGTAAGAPDCDPVRGDTGDTGNGLRSPKITSSSIGYLVSGRHMMYLPKEPTRLTTTTTAPRTIGNRNGNGQQQKQQSAGGPKMSTARLRGQASERQQVGGVASGGPVTPHTLPPPPSSHRTDNKENLQDTVPLAVVAGTSGSGTGSRASGDHPEGGHGGTTTGSFPVKLSNRRHHRFTFQSTIRQIEKRRVAEKLSREAEIKEAMRLSELEAMRRVEEEFQRKRAREKASIRHQLRLFSMEDGQTVDTDMAADDLDMINDNSHNNGNDGHHSGREESRPYDGKRSDPDGDSLPHQNVRTPGRGLYRKRDSCSTIERQQQQQYKRSITQDPYPSRQPYTNASDPTEHANGDNDDDDNVDADGDMPPGNNGARAGSRDRDNDGDSGSSLGYVDTRTPYISRIIQAKSSKSGYAMHHKLRAD